MWKIFKLFLILFLGLLCCACMNAIAVLELNRAADEYLRDGDVKTAISRLEASIELDGYSYETRYNLANAYIIDNQCEKALEHIIVAKTLIKKEPAVFLTYGSICECIIKDIEYKMNNVEGANEDVRLKRRYAKLLGDLIENFEAYIKLLPNAEDSKSIIDRINLSKDKLNSLSEYL